MSDSPSQIAPHRGFSNKAREVLLDKEDFDRSRRLNTIKGSKASLVRADSQATSSSKSSTHSIPDPLSFDNIDDVAKRKAKLHKTLADIGKTRSVDQIRLVDRQLMRTFAEDNILRLPSADSDLGDYPANSKPLPKKASKYETTDSERR